MGRRAKSVRPAAWAGTFYPADPAELAGAVRRYLAAARPGAGAPSDPGAPAAIGAIVAPHAGYEYSGPVAASAYAALSGRAGAIDRVVLAGPSHRVPVRGLAVPTCEAFETPLGPVPLDREAIEALLALPQVVESDAAHALEHSLEVHLPFLQEVLGSFRLVPLAVGDATPREAAEVLDALWSGPETLVVVSTDLSHFHDPATARRIDERTRAAVEALRPQDIAAGQACGRAALCGLLLVARARGLEPRTLDLRSSGDTAGARDEVVGYGAWTLSAPGAATTGA